MSDKVIHITHDNFNDIMSRDGLIMVDFYANWCGPCKMLAPTIEEIAKENSDIKVCKVDIDENPELAQRFQIMSIPTLVAIKDGKEVNRSVGVVPKDKIVNLVK